MFLLSMAWYLILLLWLKLWCCAIGDETIKLKQVFNWLEGFESKNLVSNTCYQLKRWIFVVLWLCLKFWLGKTKARRGQRGCWRCCCCSCSCWCHCFQKPRSTPTTHPVSLWENVCLSLRRKWNILHSTSSAFASLSFTFSIFLSLSHIPYALTHAL